MSNGKIQALQTRCLEIYRNMYSSICTHVIGKGLMVEYFPGSHVYSGSPAYVRISCAKDCCAVTSNEFDLHK